VVDVFISYSRKDLEAVSQLAAAIQRAGYNVWWDAELPPHKSYGEVITDKIENANAAIVVWSSTAAASEWVRAEADMARSQKKLIQTALGDIMPPLPFNQIQFANLENWNGEDDHSGWKKVLESLRDLCGEREPLGDGAAPAAKPSPTPPSPAAPVAAAAMPQPAHPPGSLEYHRGKKTPWPLIAGIGVGALGVVGGGAMAISALSGDDDYSSQDTAPPLSTSQPANPIEPSSADRASGTATMPTMEEVPPPPPAVPSGPTFTMDAQVFEGAIAQGEEHSFGVGLNSNTNYQIVAECDVDCSDIDMWLYDENGNLIAEDVLDDDFPVLNVTPVRSAEFTVRLQMFECSIEPCGFQIRAAPN